MASVLEHSPRVTHFSGIRPPAAPVDRRLESPAGPPFGGFHTPGRDPNPSGRITQKNIDILPSAAL